MEDKLLAFIQSIDWPEVIIRVLGFLVILGVTSLITHQAANLVRRIMHRDDVALPSNSLLINLVKGCVWAAGISLGLYWCFRIEMTAVIAALGVTGIAVSLGFQNTLSSLIGGVQLTAGKVLNSGDYVQIGTVQGRVLDITWRETFVVDIDGNKHIYPNSMLSSREVIRLAPTQSVKVPFTLRECPPELLEERLETMREASQMVVKSIVDPVEPVSIALKTSEGSGIMGEVKVRVEWFSIHPSTLQNAIIRVIAPYIT